jgi:hypothetical protein
VLSAGGIHGGPAQPSPGPVELTERQMDRVTAGAGAGKVGMQDFHFVMKQNSSSPGLYPDPETGTGSTLRPVDLPGTGKPGPYLRTERCTVIRPLAGA